MRDDVWDTIIVGQGLAGTTLGWHLVEAGQRVLLVDADEAVTSSKIAAGLITPITGQRIAPSWRYDEFLALARPFYERIEQRTGGRFFHARRALRLLQTDKERTQWAQRLLQSEITAHLAVPQPEPLLDAAIADTAGGGFEMIAAQLDVAAYLAASRTLLPFQTRQLNWNHDVTFHDSYVSVGHLNCRHVISCEGYAVTRNPHFTALKFNAAKGDILTVRFHAPLPEISLHRGIWIAPTADAEVFRVGATYDRVTIDEVPTAGAREHLEAKLRAFVHVPFTVLTHQAAVRPIIHLSEAVIGLHPQEPRLGLMNGLGSKGSLHAPWYAHSFAEHLVHGTALPADCDLRTRM